MFCRGRNSTRCRKAGSVPVYLNVYDLTSMNGCAYWLGLGAYHSGVQVHGVEYAFGSHGNATSGIFEGEPKQCEAFTFRKQIMIGWTEMSLREVRRIMKELAQDYKGTSYNLITKNCNHFCNDACVRLTGNPIPSWINRLARIGKSQTNFNSITQLSQFTSLTSSERNSSHFADVELGLFCDCIIPAGVRSCKVGIEDSQAYNGDVMKKKLRSRSGRFSSSLSSSEKSTLASAPVDLTRSFGTRSLLPPSSLFLVDSPCSSP